MWLLLSTHNVPVSSHGHHAPRTRDHHDSSILYCPTQPSTSRHQSGSLWTLLSIRERQIPLIEEHYYSPRRDRSMDRNKHDPSLTILFPSRVRIVRHFPFGRFGAQTWRGSVARKERWSNHVFVRLSLSLSSSSFSSLGFLPLPLPVPLTCSRDTGNVVLS